MASSSTFADVPACVLDGGVAVDVGEQAQAEAVLVVGGVGEAVHQDAGGGGMVGFAHPVVQLVVDNGAPVAGLLVLHRLNIWRNRDEERPEEEGGKTTGLEYSPAQWNGCIDHWPAEETHKACI